MRVCYTKINKLNLIKKELDTKKNKLIYLLNNDIMSKFDDSLNLDDLSRLKMNYDICDYIINFYPIDTSYNCCE